MIYFVETVDVNTCVAPSRPHHWTDGVQFPHHMGHYSSTWRSRVELAAGEKSVADNFTEPLAQDPYVQERWIGHSQHTSKFRAYYDSHARKLFLETTQTFTTSHSVTFHPKFLKQWCSRFCFTKYFHRRVIIPLSIKDDDFSLGNV